MRRAIPALLGAVLLVGCSVSGGSTTTQDTSESLVTVTSMTATGTTQSLISSDVSNGNSDLADVKFQNQPKSVSTNVTPFFGVTLTRYKVVFSRGDGGPVPAPFEASMSLFVPAPTVVSGVTTLGTASTTIVIVPLNAKGGSPLMDLETGKSFSANATVTFEGQDGLGRGVSVPPGGIAIVFRRP